MESLCLAAEYDPLLPLWAMELLARVFLFVWLFCLGATVGSFLNVVVYRLPRGMNLAYPGSFCPRCGHPIRLVDNIPIVSWLLLRGRCRDCRGAISPRYWLVELAVAVTFLLVLLGDWFLSPGPLAASARRPLTPHDGAAFWCMYGLHLALTATIIAAVLIRSDGFRVRARLYLPILFLGFVLPLFWPEIRSAPVPGGQNLSGWRAGLADGLAGLAMGMSIGLMGGLVWLGWQGRWPMFAPLSLGGSIGVALGWQSTLLWLPVILLVHGIAVWGLRVWAAFSAAAPSTVEAEQSTFLASQLETPPPMPPDEVSALPPHEEPDSP